MIKTNSAMKTVTLLLLFAMLMSFAPAVALTGEAGTPESELLTADEPLDEGGADIAEPETGSASASALEADTTLLDESPENVLTDDQYESFGFKMQSPSEFSGDSNPLDGYEPVSESQLYVGFMNRTQAYNGYRAVYNTMPTLSVYNATINDATQKITGGFDKNPVSPLDKYPERLSNSETTGSDNKYCAHNAIALSTGIGNAEMLVELSLYTGKDSSHKKTTSYMNLKLLTKGSGGYTLKAETNYRMSDIGDDSYKNISVLATGAVTSMAAGDYDGDGKEELAIYFPSIRTEEPPGVKIFDVENGTFKEKQTIYLSELNHPGDSTQFNFKFKDWLVPVVHLATTSISGKDDLVINASLPYRTGDNYKKHNQSPAIGIYSYTGGAMKNVFKDYLSYSFTKDGSTNVEQMRFVSATDSDINGNGVPELMLAGYQNSFSPLKSESTGDMLKAVYINFVVWEDGVYKTVFDSYDKLLKIAPKDFKQLDTSYSMMEPVSLAAARLSMALTSDFIFAAGAISQFTPGSASGTGEAAKLSGGRLITSDNINLDSVTNTYVSTSVVGKFASDHPDSEQIVVISGRGSANESIVGLVSYDISWIWMENGLIKTTMTNHNYISDHQTNNSGTFLTLCEVKDNENATYYKYEGKDFGWSSPVVFMALPALPYWKEIPRDGEVGDVSFNIANETGHSTGGDFNVGGEGFLTIGAAAGAAAAGNELMVGVTKHLSLALQYTYGYASDRRTENTENVTKIGDQDYVVAMVMPIVNYKYKTWIPAIKVDQAFLDNYNLVKEKDDPTYKVGDVIPGHEEDLVVTMQYSAEFKLMTLEKYNALCKQFGMNEFDINKGYPHTVGDPSTYPAALSNRYIPSFPTKDIDKSTSQSGQKTIESDGNGSTGFDFSKSHEIDKSYTFGADFHYSTAATAEGKVELGAAVGLSGDFGLDLNIGGSFAKGSVKGSSKGISASINDIGERGDQSAYEDYQFEIQAGVWVVEDTDQYVAPLYMGYAVTADAPPRTPENVYAYGETSSAILLSWDVPEAGNRSADYYEVYCRDSTGQYMPVVGGEHLDAKTQNYIAVKGLKSGTQYEFAFKAYKNVSGRLVSSGFSAPFFTSTQTAGNLSFSYQPADQEVSAGDGAVTFSAAAADGVNTITYLWQEFIKEEGYRYGGWETVKADSRLTISSGGSGTTLEIKNPTAADDGRIFRVLASSREPGASVSSQTIYSRAATVYYSVGGQISAPTLTLEITGGSSYNGEILAEQGSVLNLSATLTSNSAASSGPVSNASLNFYAYDSDGSIINLGTHTTVNGVAATTWTLPSLKTYKVVVEYKHEYGDNLNRLIFSNVIKVCAGTLEDCSYTITYVLEEGENNDANPLVVSKNSAYVYELQDPVNGSAVFDGWYAFDEASNSFVKVEEIVPAELTGDLTLYANWVTPESDDEEWDNPYDDVNEDDWFYDDIRYAHEKGIFNGTGDNTFSPLTPTSRAMLATVLWRIAGSPSAPGGSFGDIPEGQWYSNAVAWAKSAGIVDGIGNGLFAPGIEVSRQDMVVMITRYLDYIGFDYETDNDYVPFTDHDKIAPYAQEAVEKLAKLGIINGRGNNNFDPQGKATRAEVAAILHRIMIMLETT